jgi:hypothetical protein
VPLEDDQIFLHYGEAEFVAAKAQGKSAAQAYYMPSPVRRSSSSSGAAVAASMEQVLPVC